MILFDPRDWFWIVGEDESRAWSSAAGQYVTQYPYDRTTRIANEVELAGVLRPHGLPLPVYAIDDYRKAAQAHIDAVAGTRNYDSGASMAGYVSSSVPSWADEAAAFVAWRDAVWVYIFAQLEAVLQGQRSQPTPAELVAEIPAIEWPVID